MTSVVMSRKRGLSDAFGSPSHNKLARVGTMSCSPHKIAFLDLADHSARMRVKRSAQMMSGEENAMHQGHKALRGIVDTNVQRPAHENRDMDQSPFPSPMQGAAASCDENLDNENRRKFCRSCKARPAEHLFTADDVKEIVNRAVAKREGELRKEYDQVLQTKMAEQFNNFRRFHEDHVSWQLNRSDYSYMS